MKQSVEEKKRLSPKQYSELLKCVDLRDIFLKTANVAVNRDVFKGKASLQYRDNVKLIQNSQGVAKTEVEYSLIAKSDRKRLFVITVKYQIVFEIKRDIPDEFFKVFNEINLPLNIFPYFREYVQSTISRMGLPPLIIPLRKFLISKD